MNGINMILSNFWILTSIQMILCQVNTNTELLHEQFFNDPPSYTWLDQEKMKDNPKFLLCVDVYQKTEKMRIMEGRFTTKQGHNHISFLDFSLSVVRVIDAYNQSRRPKLVTSILCPFSNIAFEKNSYKYGVDFYITPKQDEFCVYMLSVKIKYPNGTTLVQITAEVCNVMTDIRMNQEELTTDLISHPNTHLIREQEWKPFQENNTHRYFTCLDVHEKITGAHLFNQPIDGELPIFKKVEVVLPHISGTKILSAILCDMHAIKFSKKKYIIANPYCIAPSINQGCIYKLEFIRQPTISDLIDTNYKPAVNIQQEICGIFEPVRRDIEQLEKEFLDTWIDDAQWPKTEPIPWPDIQFLQHGINNGIKMCKNVYKKIYQNNIIQNKHLSRMTTKALHLIFRTMQVEGRSILGLYCPMHLFDNDMKDIRPYYLTNSVNIGCVYVLFSQKRQFSTYMEFEVCDVYPIQYLFNIRYD